MTEACRPTSLQAALEVLGDTDRAAVAVAGCTDLLVADTAERRQHATVVDLLRIPELRGMTMDADWLSIGAATTFSELGADAIIRDRFPSLTQAAATIGGWQIQNRATIGGNIANASPAGDSLPVLLALDAELLLADTAGERLVAYSDMHRGYRQTALRRGELIVRVRLPLSRTTSIQRFVKVGTRQAQAISKVVVAFAVELTDGRMHNARLAAGSVAATPVRLFAAEALCEGRIPDRSTAAAVAAAARDAVQPIDDVRSTAAYRKFALERVVRRMIRGLGETEAGTAARR